MKDRKRRTYNKMGKSYTKHYLHISYQRIITCMCYTTLIIGWHAFNCISLLGVMSMEFLHENSESTTTSATAEVINLSQASMKSSGNQQENISSATPPPLTHKRSMEMSKLDFATPNAVDNAPIQGWECYCWNTTTGFEVNSIKNHIQIQKRMNDQRKRGHKTNFRFANFALENIFDNCTSLFMPCSM